MEIFFALDQIRRDLRHHQSKGRNGRVQGRPGEVQFAQHVSQDPGADEQRHRVEQED